MYFACVVVQEQAGWLPLCCLSRHFWQKQWCTGHATVGSIAHLHALRDFADGAGDGSPDLLRNTSTKLLFRGIFKASISFSTFSIASGSAASFLNSQK